MFNRHLPDWEPVAAGLFLAAVSAIVACCWKTRPYFLMGWLWYLGTLVPVIGLVQVGGQAMADHYTYIPSIGLFVVCLWGAWDLAGGWRHGTGHPGLAGLGGVGGLRPSHRQTDPVLAERRVTFCPQFGSGFRKTSWRGVIMPPTSWGLTNSTAARLECEKSISIESNYETAHGILGNVLLLQGKYDQAARELATALQLNPAADQGRLFYGLALLGQNHPAEAEEQFDKALAAEPLIPDAHYGLGRALLELGKPEEALAQFTETLRFGPAAS